MESYPDKMSLDQDEEAMHASKQDIRKCILIYEDDFEILFLCKKLLSGLYRVETLTRCENVINDIAFLKPDLILMDLWIPEIGGDRATMLVKENPDSKNIPVLLFSANAEIEEICEKVHANGFIKKPFDIHDLKNIIAENIL